MNFQKKIFPNLMLFDFQVVRMRLDEGRRIVGTLIPTSAMDTLVRTLKSGAESHNTEIQEVTIDD